MSSTNKTTYYELPQFVDNDIFNPLVDDNDAYSKIDTALHNIADAEADDASEIVGIKSRLDSAENDIDALEAQNGDSVLTTTAKTLSGAVNELDADVNALDGRLDVVEDDINNVSTGLKVKVEANTGAINNLETVVDTKITYFSTVADMKVADLKAGDYAETKGYRTAGDNGGAKYNIVATEPAEGVFYESLNNGKYAVLIIEPSMTFEMFGAYGDGEHDDSSVIQTAIRSCGKINAVGIYRIENAIELNITGDITPELGTQKNCVICGRGKNISLMNSVASLSDIDASEATFIFDGGYFHLRGTSRVDFTNCVFMGKTDVLKAETAFNLTDPARHLIVSDSTFVNLKYGVYCDNNYRWSGESIYSGLYFAHCEYGLYYENGGKDCIVTKCIAQGNTDYFVMLKDALGCLFSENHDYSAYGTYLYYGASIVNNYFDGLNKLHIKTDYDVSGSSTGKHSSHGVDIVGNIFLTNLHNTTYTGNIACIVVDNNMLISATICNNTLHGGADNANIALIDMTNVDYAADNVIHGNTGIGLNYLFKNAKNSAINYYHNQFGGFTPHVTVDSSLSDVRKSVIKCNGGFIIFVRINNPTDINSGAITIDNCPPTTDVNSITILTKNDDSVAIFTNSSLSDYTVAGKKQVSIYFVNMGTVDIAEMLLRINEV